jgi:sn-glycerol 3-phosphate transport system ATP-binding protein
MASITMQDLQKTYPGASEAAVKGISLDIPDGEFVVLVGPSGCGKSTLLRMVAGLETITSGELRIGDRIVNGLEPAERDIAMVFQNYALYPHMTVFNNLAYGLKNRGYNSADIKTRVNAAAKMLEIEQFLDRKPRALSGGQRQRVAMGRALVREPTAFLLDEPLSNLDAKLRVQMRVEIKHLQRRLRTTSLYVTHDQLEAMTLGDRLVVLNGGAIEQVGTPIEVYERPETTFVASFIGSPAMNLLPLDFLIASEPGNAVALEGLPGQTDLIGIRPDDMHIDPPQAPHLIVKGVLELFEPVGAESHLYVRLGDAMEPTVIRLAGRPTMTEGTTMRFFVRADAVHPFSSASGKRTN